MKAVFNRCPELKACRFCENLNIGIYYEYGHECTSMCIYEEGKDYDLDYANGCKHFKPCDKIKELIKSTKFKEENNEQINDIKPHR